MSVRKKGREIKEAERKNEEEKKRQTKKKELKRKFEITASASASWFAQLQPAPGPRLL